MLIYGAHEPVFLEETFLASKEMLPELRLERIESGGHFAHQDAPAEVNRLILDFIA
jgi:pimeloyl-ACP methyl ester carboxylesterase